MALRPTHKQQTTTWTLQKKRRDGNEVYENMTSKSSVYLIYVSIYLHALRRVLSQKSNGFSTFECLRGLAKSVIC
jgi:hypothetical protein